MNGRTQHTANHQREVGTTLSDDLVALVGKVGNANASSDLGWCHGSGRKGNVDEETGIRVTVAEVRARALEREGKDEDTEEEGKKGKNAARGRMKIRRKEGARCG